MTEDANARVRSYLLSQAERYDWHQLWPRVLRARLEVVEALDGVSDPQAAWRPAPEAWSIGECARHLLTSSRNNRRLIEGLMRGEQRRDDPDPPLTADDTPIQEVRTALIDDGARFGALITAVPNGLDLTPRLEHRMFGPLNAREWFLFQHIHDLDHVGQIRAVREAQGFPASEGAAS